MHARTVRGRQILALAIGITAPLVSSFYLGRADELAVKTKLWSLVFSPAPEMQGYPYAIYRLTVDVTLPDGRTRSYPERELDQIFRANPLARVSFHRTLRLPDQLAQWGTAFFCGHPELQHVFPAKTKIDFVYSHGNEKHVVEVRCP